MKHLGILATTPDGAALCFRAFCQDGIAELGSHDHPDVTLDCIALARSLPAWQAGDYATVRATLPVSARRIAAAGADFFVCQDNTAHVALQQPGPSLPLPGLHVAEWSPATPPGMAAARAAPPASSRPFPQPGPSRRSLSWELSPR